MATMWGDVDPVEVRQVWAENLGRFVADDLRAALETMPMTYKAYPPTLPQFVDLCADAKRARAQAAVKLDGPHIPMPADLFNQLRAVIKAKTGVPARIVGRDLEREAERAAIQGEAA